MTTVFHSDSAFFVVVRWRHNSVLPLFSSATGNILPVFQQSESQILKSAFTWEHRTGERFSLPALSVSNCIFADCKWWHQPTVVNDSFHYCYPDRVHIHHYNDIVQYWSKVRAQVGHSPHAGRQENQESQVSRMKYGNGFLRDLPGLYIQCFTMDVDITPFCCHFISATGIIHPVFW